MLVKVLAGLVALLAGGWMVIDGLYVIARGKYIGPPTPGPWRLVFERIGVDPFRFGPMFVALGAAWLLAAAALQAGQRWGWHAGVVLAIGTLWYLPLGTMLSVVYLILLLAGRGTLLGPG